MFNGGGTGRILNWHLKTNSEIMCVFVTNDEDHRKLIDEIVSNINSIDRIMGDDVAFLLLFPRSIYDIQDEDSDFRPMRDLLGYYAPKEVSDKFMPDDVRQSLMDRFGIPHDKFPCMLVFSRGFPDEPIIFDLPKDLNSADFEKWFRQLSIIAEKLKIGSESLTNSAPISRIRDVVYRASLVERDISVSMKKFGDTLTDLANRHHLPRRLKWKLLPLMNTRWELEGAFDRVFAEIFHEEPELKISISEDRQFLRLKKYSMSIDNLYQKLEDSLGIYKEPETVEELLEITRRKFAELQELMRTMRLRNMRGEILTANIRSTADFVNSIKGFVGSLYNLLAEIKKFGGL